MSNGMMVTLGILSDNSETVDAINISEGKLISEISFGEECLDLKLIGGSTLRVWDYGQSCCENRYMTTDDDLKYFEGSRLIGFELTEGPADPADKYENEHDRQFLHVKTSKGSFTIETHNEHNGYYGGFWVRARMTEGGE